MEKNEQKEDKVIRIIMKTLYSILAILAGFTFIAIGVYLHPAIIERLIETGSQAIGLFGIIFDLGIIGGAFFLILLGLKEVHGEKFK